MELFVYFYYLIYLLILFILWKVLWKYFLKPIPFIYDVFKGNDIEKEIILNKKWKQKVN